MKFWGIIRHDSMDQAFSNIGSICKDVKESKYLFASTSEIRMGMESKTTIFIKALLHIHTMNHIKWKWKCRTEVLFIIQYP